MNRRTDKASGLGDLLPLEHTLAQRNAGLSGRTEMLGQWNHQPSREWRPLNRRAVGRLLALRGVYAAMNIPDVQ